MTNEKDTNDAPSDDSVTKAPEDDEHVTSTPLSDDPRQRPGGGHPAGAEVGMSAIHPDEVPGVGPETSQAAVPDRDDRPPGSSR
jgi:hypothetical protein